MEGLNERYCGKTGDDLLNQILSDFGPKAAESLEKGGFLTLNDAVKLRNEYMLESLGIEEPTALPKEGELVGFRL